MHRHSAPPGRTHVWFVCVCVVLAAAIRADKVLVPCTVDADCALGEVCSCSTAQHGPRPGVTMTRLGTTTSPAAPGNETRAVTRAANATTTQPATLSTHANFKVPKAGAARATPLGIWQLGVSAVTVAIAQLSLSCAVGATASAKKPCVCVPAPPAAVPTPAPQAAPATTVVGGAATLGPTKSGGPASVAPAASILPCSAAMVCQNKGQANGSPGHCGCTCAKGYGGTWCETPLACTSEDTTCGSNGQVKGTTGSCGCTCSNGHWGATCEKAPEPVVAFSLPSSVASGATAVEVDTATQAAAKVGDVMTFTNGDNSETVTIIGFGSAKRRRARAAAAIKFKPKLKRTYGKNTKVSVARPQFYATVLTGISFPGQSTSF